MLIGKIQIQTVPKRCVFLVSYSTRKEGVLWYDVTINIPGNIDICGE